MIDAMQKATRKQTKYHNKRLILKTIYDQNQISRAEIARLTRLTRTTVSSAVTELMDEGFVAEVGHGLSEGGKPPILLSLVDDSRHLIGVDLANSEFRGVVVNLRGKVRHRASIPARGKSGEEALVLVYELIDTLIAATQSNLLGIGLGTPGVIDPNGGIVQEAVNLGWKNLPLQDSLTNRYGLPVYIANDSHAAALAEYTFGSHKKATNLVVVKVGQGIGAGLVVNGQLFYGDGFGAGEIGHVVVRSGGERCTCGNFGCLETVSSSRAITGQAQIVAQNEPQSLLHKFVDTLESITVDDIFEAFQAGDTTVEPIIANAGRYLGVAVANLIGVLNIQHILIAGSLSRFDTALLDPLKQEANQLVFTRLFDKTKIKVAGLGTDIVPLGAAALLLTHEMGVV